MSGLLMSDVSRGTVVQHVWEISDRAGFLKKGECFLGDLPLCADALSA
jgi:hypothetical protein